MINLKDVDMFDRIGFQQFLSNTLDYLLREKKFYEDLLVQKPKDITAMGQLKRVDNDIAIVMPKVKECQMLNLTEIEKMTGKQFAYLLENKDMSKDLIRKS